MAKITAYQEGKKAGIKDRRSGAVPLAGRWLVEESKRQMLIPSNQRRWREGYDYGYFFGHRRNPPPGWQPAKAVKIERKGRQVVVRVRK